jgi:hypothetical protein
VATLPGGKIKRGRASLIGGAAVGVCVLALWLGIEHELGMGGVGLSALGVLVAVGVGGWIRAADL